MVNRYYRGTEYRPELSAPPVQFIGAALEQAQKQYDTNFAAAQGLKNKYIQARAADRARANELQSQFESRIDSVASKYNGDYSQASKELYQLQNDMSKLYAPGGEAFAIQQNYAAEQDSLKREQERLAKGEIQNQQLQSLRSFYDRQGPTTLDPNTGTYSQLKRLDLAKYYDVNKEFTEILNGVKPRTVERAYRTGRIVNGEVESVTKKEQFIDPNEVANAFESKMWSDDGIRNYYYQQAELMGQDPKQTFQNVIDTYKTQVIPSRTGVIEDSQKLDYKVNWKTEADYKFKHQWALAEKSHQDALKRLKAKSEMDSGVSADGQSAYLTVAGDANSQFTPIPEVTKAAMPSTASDPLGIMSWMVGTKSFPTNVSALLANRNNPAYNYDRLEAIKKGNPNLPDSDIIRKYNEVMSKDTGSREFGRITYDPINTTPVQQEEVNRILPGLLQGTYVVYKKDNATGKVVKLPNASDVQALGKKLQNEKNPLKSDYGALGRARGASGHVPSGSLIIPDPYGKGDYYFVEPNGVNMKNYQEQVLNKAFGDIQNPSIQEGPAFPVNDPVTGKTLSYAKWKKTYDSDGIGTIAYYPVTLTPDGKELTNYNDPFTVDGRLATSSDMERSLVPFEIIQKMTAHKKLTDQENEYATQ